jgi:hypothetical protein
LVFAGSATGIAQKLKAGVANKWLFCSSCLSELVLVLVCTRAGNGKFCRQNKDRQKVWFVFRAARQTAPFHRRFALLKCR